MKYLKFILSLLITVAIFYGLNTKFGNIPPLGKFLDPFHGFWKNETTETNNPSTHFNISGLLETVTVHYDEQLIPHIFAQNDLDLYRTQGYVTAKHRLWQMEFQTLASAGRLSNIIGKAAINYDKGQRRKGMVFGAEQSVKIMSENTVQRRLLEAYRDGINEYISSLGDGDMPIEYKLLDYKPELWTLEKTALLLMYMTDMLAGGDSDLENTNAMKLWGKEIYELLYPDFYADQDPIIPQGRDWSYIQSTVPERPETTYPSEFIAKTMEKPHPQNGSNNWAVSPDKSITGNAILANDPHLGLNLPSIWYAMQLSTPGHNAFGVTLPGALGVVIGHTDSIAWGETNATRDVKDWYKIQFQDKSRSTYLYDGEWKQTIKKIEEIKVRGEATVYDTVIYTHHGPVSYDHTFGETREDVGYAMKWMGHLPSNIQQTFLELNKAKNYEDYKKALKHFSAPAQNFVFASTSGDIAIWVQGNFPNKWEEQGKFLLDGTNSAHEWQGFIPQEHNAHVKNPERGFVSSANQHPTDENYPYYVYDNSYETYRNRVINEFFRVNDKISVSDVKKLHGNNFNLKASEIIPTMLQALSKANLNEAEVAFYEEIAEWDFYNDIDKNGPTIWEEWWQRLRRMSWDEMRVDSIALAYPSSYQTIWLLKNKPDFEFFDILGTQEKETASDLYLKSFKEAVVDLTERKEKGNYNWGDYKGTYVGHLLQGLPAFSRFNLPIGGGGSIVNATSRNHGPSWRMVIEMSETPKTWAIYPGGQSGNPGSKYYDNFIDDWAAGNYFEALFLKSVDERSDKILFTQTFNPSK